MFVFVIYTVDKNNKKELVKAVDTEIEAMKIVNQFVMSKAYYKKVKI